MRIFKKLVEDRAVEANRRVIIVCGLKNCIELCAEFENVNNTKCVAIRYI